VVGAADDVVTCVVGVVAVVAVDAVVVDVSPPVGSVGSVVAGAWRVVEVSAGDDCSSAAHAVTAPSAKIATAPSGGRRGDSRRPATRTVTAPGTGVTA
jgi:hypothetical protein